MSKKIMNHGFIIYQNENKTTVKKIKTPASPTDVLHDEVSSDCSTRDFSNYDEAMQFCYTFIDSGKEKANLKECHAYVAWNKTGLSLQSASLENVFAASYGEAHEMATTLAEAYLKKNDIKVDDFEVEVRPVTLHYDQN